MTRMATAQLAQTAAGKRSGIGGKVDAVTHVIGIDPGKETGLAVWDKITKTFSVIESIPHFTALKKAAAFDKGCTKIVIEVPRTKANFHGSSSHTQSVNIGMVIGQARLMADYLKAEGFDVIEKHPRGKVDAEGFKRLTGYQGRTNEHSRDAGMLARSA